MISAIKEGNLTKLKEHSEPIEKDSSIVVKLEACGICGSDLGNIFGIFIHGVIVKDKFKLKNLLP